MFTIKDLSIEVNNNILLKSVNLELAPSEMLYLLGPNGSGKSSLSQTVLGNPQYKVLNGSIYLDGEDITNDSIFDKARKGIFVSYQNPIEIPGLSISSYLKYSVNSLRRFRNEPELDSLEFFKEVNNVCDILCINKELLKRNVNENFSGGEKKKFQCLELLLIQPKIAILDEIDTGVDIDSLEHILYGINYCRDKFNTCFIMITHNLDIVYSDNVYIVKNNTIEHCNNFEEIKEKGFQI